MPHDKWGSREVADPRSPYHPFPTPFDQIDTQDGFSDQAPDHFSPPYSLQEIDMLALSYEIRQKPDWARKLRDSDIRTKWRAEALGKRNEEAGFAERTGENYSGYDVEEVERPKLTEKMVDYVLDELELHAEKLNDPHGIQVRGSRCCRSARSYSPSATACRRPASKVYTSPTRLCPKSCSISSSRTSPSSRRTRLSASPTGTLGPTNKCSTSFTPRSSRSATV